MSSTDPDPENLPVYDEVEIEDMTYDEILQVYHYPCPCGDRFQIALVDLFDEQDIAVCPSCSLMVRVIFDVDDLPTPLTMSSSSGEQISVAA
ncbi:Diphthamide biosynthesis protein 3 [Claviceps digitariae]|nr:Diphthamide biosynthesis protein 3 [Claviceps digitariae]